MNYRVLLSVLRIEFAKARHQSVIISRKSMLERSRKAMHR